VRQPIEAPYDQPPYREAGNKPIKSITPKDPAKDLPENARLPPCLQHLTFITLKKFVVDNNSRQYEAGLLPGNRPMLFFR
jgi:hypothetical protein